MVQSLQNLKNTYSEEKALKVLQCNLEEEYTYFSWIAFHTFIYHLFIVEFIFIIYRWITHIKIVAFSVKKKKKKTQISALQVTKYHSLNSYKVLIAACHCSVHFNRSQFSPTLHPLPVSFKNPLSFSPYWNRWLKSLWISKRH